VTLAWKPGESGQKDLVDWFMSGDEKAYKIKYPNGAVDIFTGWVNSLGKTIARNEVITRSAQITNKGKPSLAEDNASTTA
ncbi:phage tail tube protein, partial [Klebsiella pneumoniae]